MTIVRSLRMEQINVPKLPKQTWRKCVLYIRMDRQLIYHENYYVQVYYMYYKYVIAQ